MAIDARLAPVREEIKESQLAPLPSRSLNAFALALIAERDDDATGVTKWLDIAIKYEAK